MVSTKAPVRGTDRIPGNGGTPRVKQLGVTWNGSRYEPYHTEIILYAGEEINAASSSDQGLSYLVPPSFCSCPKKPIKALEEDGYEDSGSNVCLVHKTKFEGCDCGGIDGLSGWRQCKGHMRGVSRTGTRTDLPSLVDPIFGEHGITGWRERILGFFPPTDEPITQPYSKETIGWALGKLLIGNRQNEKME